VKCFYTLLFTLIASTQLFAENWVKYEVSVKDMIIPLGNCYKLSNQLIDSVDLDCTSSITAIEFALQKNTILQENEIEEILKYYPNLKTITFQFNSYLDTLFVIKLPDAVKQVNISNIQKKHAFISLSGSNIDSIRISTNSRDLSLHDLPENLKYLFINNASFSTGWAPDTFNIHISQWPGSLVTFLTERTMAFCNDILPAGLQNFGTRYTLENKAFIDQLLNKNKNLPNFNLLTLYSNNDEDLYDLSTINHIKRLCLTIPSNHILSDGLFGIEILPENLVYIKFDRIITYYEMKFPSTVRTVHYEGYEDSKYIKNHPLSLDTFIVTNTGSVTLPPLPPDLKYLRLFNHPKLTCLPSLPNTLRKFDRDQLGVQCLPNETPWVKASEEWPLCTDASKICNTLNQMLISGTAYIDVNQNNIIDTEDIIAEDIVVKANGEYSSTFKDGKYHLIIHEPGTYSLELSANYDNVLEIFPTKPQATVNAAQPNDTINFLIRIKPEIDLEIIGTNSVARPGMRTHLSVFLKNRNILPAQNSIVKILAPSAWVKDNISPAGYIIANDTIIWNNISVSSLGSEHFSLSGTLPATATILGDPYQYEMWVENEGDIATNNNYYKITDTIRGSYDPNDKIVNHSTLTPELSNSKELIYTIRFQNTGTDTAFKVVVIDTITGNLDPASIRVIGASHDYTWDYTGQGIATFIFENILLPDSNVNEPESHGFITLALKPTKNLAAGDSIYNRAGIYFDFNEPIITNHANTKIAISTPVYTNTSTPLSIYPNPAKSQVHIKWSVTEPAILRLSDISGKIIRTEKLINGMTDINIDHLPKGLYIIQLQAGQNLATGKLVVQ